MSTQVLRRRQDDSGPAAEVSRSLRESTQAKNINSPPEDVEALSKEIGGESLTFDSFTSADAWDLGHLLHARLRHHPRATLISISLATGLVVFQTTAGGPGGFGSGVAPDNENWVARKRNSVMRWGKSTWSLHCKFGADEERFASAFCMSREKAGTYAIHGGAIPIYVRGVVGVVAVVVVSGLKQHEDHGVIVDVVKENWELVA